MRQPGGTEAPTTPSTPRSLAATASALPAGVRTTNGFSTPAEIPARASASRPSIASPRPGRSFAWASLGFIWTPRKTSTPTIAAPIAAIVAGRRTTSRDQRVQNPSSPASTSLRGRTRSRLIRWPSMPRSAGRSVIAAITETAGMSMPPIPIERMKGSGSTIMLSRPTATVVPETITECPACVIVSTSAVSTSSPAASSSRKRKIISRA